MRKLSQEQIERLEKFYRDLDALMDEIAEMPLESSDEVFIAKAYSILREIANESNHALSEIIYLDDWTFQGNKNL